MKRRIAVIFGQRQNYTIILPNIVLCNERWVRRAIAVKANDAIGKRAIHGRERAAHHDLTVGLES